MFVDRTHYSIPTQHKRPKMKEPGAIAIARGASHGLLWMFAGMLLSSMLFAACANPFGSNGGSTATSQAGTPSSSGGGDQPLTALHWCSKPSMLFRDEGAIPTPTVTTTPGATGTPTTTPTTIGATATPSTGITQTPTAGPGTPTTLTSWDQVKANLGFTIFLPASLPGNTCLVSAQATVHDPIFGASFLIGYLLPDHTSITFSEAPVTSQNASFQCSVSQSGSGKTSQLTPGPTPLPLQLCSGAKNSTSIVLSARGSVEYLQQVFSSLQPDVTWIPAS